MAKAQGMRDRLLGQPTSLTGIARLKRDWPDVYAEVMECVTERVEGGDLSLLSDRAFSNGIADIIEEATGWTKENRNRLVGRDAIRDLIKQVKDGKKEDDS